jgi:hypothetical protein
MRGLLHHVELWVPDLAVAVRSWGWLLGELGWTTYQRWDAGRSWRLAGTYPPALTTAGSSPIADPWQYRVSAVTNVGVHKSTLSGDYEDARDTPQTDGPCG